MKLLFIYYDRLNYYAGPIVNARRLLPELHRRGHEVHCLLLYMGSGAGSADFLKQQGVQCHLSEFGRFTEQHIRWILQKVVEIGPDVFIPNLSVSGWFAAHWVRQSGIPTVAVHRSDDLFHWVMVDQFVTGDSKWSLSGLVCVSEGLRNRVAALRPQHTQLCVIPSGIPFKADSYATNGPLRLVYVGRIVNKQKRVLDMIDSFAVLMSHCPAITATLIGNGDARQQVKQRIAHHGLEKRIFLHGTVPSEEIQSELKNYHVLVLLSDYEGTPGAVMDGMAAGLVPVCLDIPGGVRELVIHEQTGLLVKNRGIDFIRAIKALESDHKLRKRLSANAQKHIAQNFSLAVTTDRWEAFCQSLIEAAGPRTPISIPNQFSLPPVRRGLDREDRRMPESRWRLRLRRFGQALHRIFPVSETDIFSLNKDFIEPRLTVQNLDRFLIRQSILEALSNQLGWFRGTLLDVGCGRMPYKDFILKHSTVENYTGIDLETALDYGTDTGPDKTWDGISMPFGENIFNTAMATEVLEHCHDPHRTLSEIYRVLAPGGFFFFTVPFLWNLHEVPNDEYRYTPFALERHLRDVGFQQIEIHATGGWHASMAQMLGLWVRRSPMTPRKRRWLSHALKPVISYLITKDSIPYAFSEGTMITGLYGTARK